MTDPWHQQRPDQGQPLPYQRPPWQQHSQQQPQQQQGWPTGGQPTDARPSRSSGGRLVAGIVIGLVAAVLIGAVLVLTNVVRLGPDEATGPDTTPIELPDELAGLRDQAAVVKDRSGKNEDRLLERLEHSNALTVERYQEAFDGAAVGVRTYATDDLQFFPTVIAIRAASPGLFTGPVVDLADLGAAAQPGVLDVQKDDPVECLVSSTRFVPEGEKVDPDDKVTPTCRRADGALTVYVHGVGNGVTGHAKMVEVANAAFDALSAMPAD